MTTLLLGAADFTTRLIIPIKQHFNPLLGGVFFL